MDKRITGRMLLAMDIDGTSVGRDHRLGEKTRQALRRYGEGSVCAAWAQVIGAVLAWYDRNDPVCAQLLRLRYLQGLPEEKVIARLYVGRTTYYTKELEALSTVAVCAADAGLLPGGQMSGVF